MRRNSDPGRVRLVLRAGAWGAVAAMAMSGMRTLTHEAGWVGETPPEAMAREGAGGLFEQVPPARRRAVVELSHWGFGAVGGVAFSVLPRWLRRRGWAGPAYGLLVWLGFEAGLAPALGLSKARATRSVERTAFAADHVLYGLVLAKGLERRRT